MRALSRKLSLVALDGLLLSAAFFAAYWLRLGWEGMLSNLSLILLSLPLLLPLSLYIHARFGLYNAIFRYASIETALAVVKSVLLSVLIASLVLFLTNRLEGIPRSVFVIYSMTACLVVGGSRLAARIVLHLGDGGGRGIAKRVLVYGAGDLGALAFRGLRTAKGRQERIVGFIDDDPSKKEREIHGVRVLGGLGTLSEIAQAVSASEIWVCIRKLPGERMREVCSVANSMGLPVRIMLASPSEAFAESQLQTRAPRIEDLLRRPPRKLDSQRVRKWIQGRRVLVTGAGGSIGSELCRQVAAFSPSRLILCDASELNLFNIDRELRGEYKGIIANPYLLSVDDESRVSAMFTREQPEIVFHAAAYKHVPLMEHNPFEGIVNNIKGTLLTAQYAVRHGVKHLVFISTDKAVHPVSVMGKTKRVGELICRALNKGSDTKYMVVRFGNVLGSSGSVLHVFQEQIRKGVPVTVTHPDMTRYFMLISEAVELVIQAGSVGSGGEVFLLDMGKPVKIRDMAEQLISLMAGNSKERIGITYTGPRPGEKIEEELLVSSGDQQTEFPDLFLDGESDTHLEWGTLRPKILELVRQASLGSPDCITALNELASFSGSDHCEESPSSTLHGGRVLAKGESAAKRSE